jgi:hypothetical protein
LTRAEKFQRLDFRSPRQGELPKAEGFHKMSFNKFIFLFTIIILLAGGFWFFRTLPPSVIFNRSRPSPTAILLPTPPPNTSPQDYPLPTPVKTSFGWATLVIPEKKLQFDYPEAWGFPSASITHFAPPDSGTLMGIYFLDNQLEDTPVFLELTSTDYKNTVTVSALFSASQDNLTNTILSENNLLAYYTYASFPHLKIYVYLPGIQDNLPKDNLQNYFQTTSAKIFSGTGLSSASDSANFRDFQKLIKSIQILP